MPPIDWIRARCAELGVTLPFFPMSETKPRPVPPGWEILRPALAQKLAAALNSRYPSRIVVPFARRLDSDDIVCVVASDTERRPSSIVVLHDYASPGWEVVAEFDDAEAWLSTSLEAEE
jgi:hypothetical protein